MDRRLFVSGLIGAVGTTAMAAALPRSAKALASATSLEPTAPRSDVLPNLEMPAIESGDEPEQMDENIELAWHEGRSHRRRRRRRRRVRRWRRFCRRYWHDGFWRRRCRRRPFWIWIWIG